MGFRSLRECCRTLQKEGQLLEIDHPVDPYLEIAEVQNPCRGGCKTTPVASGISK